MRDLRDAFRSLVATPVVAVVAILSLALGIGANTAIFSILDRLILRTLPVIEPQRLVMIDRGSWTNPIWEAIRDRQQAFEGATAWSPTRFNLAAGGQTELVDGVWASGRFFEVLGTSAILGRTFAPDDDRRGGGPDGPVAVISYSFWQRRFGGRADVIGNPLMVERVSYTIIGVTPPEFFGAEVGRKFDVAIPIGTEPGPADVSGGFTRDDGGGAALLLRSGSTGDHCGSGECPKDGMSRPRGCAGGDAHWSTDRVLQGARRMPSRGVDPGTLGSDREKLATNT